MTELRLDDQVGIVTGAGSGLGKAHALHLASRGAKVLVNDASRQVYKTRSLLREPKLNCYRLLTTWFAR